MTLNERLESVRRDLLRNGYLLERTRDEWLRIRQARDVVDGHTMRRRDGFAKRLERNTTDSDHDEHNATLADLATLQAQPAVAPVLP